MKTDINIYLSSTNFPYDESCYQDHMWKEELKIEFRNKLHEMERKLMISFHDPLQTISDQPEIVMDDIHHIIGCDFVISYLPKTKLTIGTIMELQYSLLQKPKDCIILIDRYLVHRNHPWIKYWVKHIVDNEGEAAQKVLNILGNGNFTNLKEG